MSGEGNLTGGGVSWMREQVQEELEEVTGLGRVGDGVLEGDWLQNGKATATAGVVQITKLKWGVPAGDGGRGGLRSSMGKVNHWGRQGVGCYGSSGQFEEGYPGFNGIGWEI